MEAFTLPKGETLRNLPEIQEMSEPPPTDFKIVPRIIENLDIDQALLTRTDVPLSPIKDSFKICVSTVSSDKSKEEHQEGTPTSRLALKRTRTVNPKASSSVGPDMGVARKTADPWRYRKSELPGAHFLLGGSPNDSPVGGFGK